MLAITAINFSYLLESFWEILNEFKSEEQRIFGLFDNDLIAHGRDTLGRWFGLDIKLESLYGTAYLYALSLACCKVMAWKRAFEALFEPDWLWPKEVLQNHMDVICNLELYRKIKAECRHGSSGTGTRGIECPMIFFHHIWTGCRKLAKTESFTPSHNNRWRQIQERDLWSFDKGEVFDFAYLQGFTVERCADGSAKENCEYFGTRRYGEEPLPDRCFPTCAAKGKTVHVLPGGRCSLLL